MSPQLRSVVARCCRSQCATARRLAVECVQHHLLVVAAQVDHRHAGSTGPAASSRTTPAESRPAVDVVAACAAAALRPGGLQVGGDQPVQRRQPAGAAMHVADRVDPAARATASPAPAGLTCFNHRPHRSASTGSGEGGDAGQWTVGRDQRGRGPERPSPGVEQALDTRRTALDADGRAARGVRVAAAPVAPARAGAAAAPPPGRALPVRRPCGSMAARCSAAATATSC